MCYCIVLRHLFLKSGKVHSRDGHSDARRVNPKDLVQSILAQIQAEAPAEQIVSARLLPSVAAEQRAAAVDEQIESDVKASAA